MCCDVAAFDYIYDQANSGDLERVVGASSDDVNFLCDVLGNPIFASLVQVKYFYWTCILCVDRLAECLVYFSVYET